MAILLNAARAIFGPSGIGKWEGLLFHVCLWLQFCPLFSASVGLCESVSIYLPVQYRPYFSIYYFSIYLLFFSPSLCPPQCLGLHLILFQPFRAFIWSILYEALLKVYQQDGRQLASAIWRHLRGLVIIKVSVKHPYLLQLHDNTHM